MDNIATTEEVFVSNVYVLNLGKTPAIHFLYCQCTYFLSTMRIDNWQQISQLHQRENLINC